MARNGSGVYSLPANSWYPAVSGVSASYSDWNATAADIQTALTQSVSADGQTTMTGSLNFGSSYRPYNVANASATGHPVVYGQGSWSLGAGTITGALTLSGAVTATGGATVGTAAWNFTDTYLQIVGSGDATKIARFEVDGITTGTTRTYTLQDSSDTLVGRATTDTLTNKTLTAPVLNGSLTGTSIALQADMATPTAADKAVAPSVVQYHPGVAKAWCVFDGTGGLGAVTVPAAQKYNITSVTKNGAGDYTIVVTTAFSTAQYSCVAMASNSTSPVFCFVAVATTPTSTTIRINVRDTSGVAQNSDRISVVMHGTQRWR